MFLIGSRSPSIFDERRLDTIFSFPLVRHGLAENGFRFSGSDIPALLLGDRVKLLETYNDFSIVSDDRPRTEYFPVRHTFRDFPAMKISHLLHRIQTTHVICNQNASS